MISLFCKKPKLRKAISLLNVLMISFSMVLSGLPLFSSQGGVGSASANLNPGKIAFASTRDGNNEIYIMNEDGSAQTNLTNDLSNDNAPAISPDGSKIAFTTVRDGNSEIYVMGVDGSNPVNLTNNAAGENDAYWSPDGSKIVFFSSRDADNELYVMNSDGSNQTRLTNSAGDDIQPEWSPDGTRIAFKSMRTGNAEIFVINADGSNPVNITNDVAADDTPTWSPDSSQIAFTSMRDGNKEIFVSGADGLNPINITNTAGPTGNYLPTWSPDGSKIAFVTDRDTDLEIFSMGVDGSNPVNLTNNIDWDSNPDWGVASTPPPSDAIGPTTFIGIPTPYEMVSGNVNIGTQIDDTGSGGSSIQQAEYFITPSGGTPGANGTGIPLSAGDGTFDSPWEGATATWDSTSTPDGINIIHIHGQDSAGNWGEFATVPVDVENGQTDTTPPELIGSAPVNNAPSVPVTIRQIDLSFSEPIQPADASVIGTNLKFKKQDGSEHTTRFINFSNVSGNDYVIDLFDADLMPDTTYIVEISGFEDAAANIMAPTNVTFTTAPNGAPSGPISRWSAEGNADDSIGTNHGMTNNGVSFQTGKTGQAFSIDGVDDYVSANSLSGLTGDVTLDAWVKWNGSNNLNSNQAILYNGNPADSGYGLYVGDAGNIFGLLGGVNSLYTNTYLTQGQWQHLALVRNGNLWKIYLNGEIVPIISYDNEFNFVPNSPAGNLFIGGKTGVESFNGLIDEAEIYDRALNAEEIAELAGMTPPPQPFVTHFRVDPVDNNAWGHAWLPQTQLTITIEEGGIPVFNGNATSDPEGNINFDLNGFDVQAGHLVRVSDGATTKEHVVTSVQITGVDPVNNTVFGTAEPGSELRVGVHGINIDRSVLADSEGNWIVDFSVPGPESYQEVHDIVPGSGGYVFHSDEDQDGTQPGWNVSNPRLGAMIDHNWISGWGLPAYENVSVLINDGSKASFNVDTDGMGNLWAEGWMYGFQIERGDKIDVYHSGGVTTMFVQNFNASFDLDNDTISGTALTPEGYPLTGSLVDISISQEGQQGELHHAQTTVDTEGNFLLNISPFDLQQGMSIFITVDDATDGSGDGHRTHVAPMNETPMQPTLGAMIDHNWIEGYNLPAGEIVNVLINSGAKASFTAWTDPMGGLWAEGSQYGFQLERGDQIDVFYSGGSVFMTVQNLNASADVNNDTISGTALSLDGTTPLAGNVDITVRNASDFTIVHESQISVLPDGSFTFNLAPLDLLPGMRIFLSFQDMQGHRTHIAPSNPFGIEVLNVSPEDGSKIGLWTWLDSDGHGSWQYVVYEYSVDGITWNNIGTDFSPYVNNYDNPYSSSYFGWETIGVADGTYQVRATAHDFGGAQASKIVTYTVDKTSPPTPINLTAVPAEGIAGGIKLTWNNPEGSDATRYIVFRAKNSGGDWYDGYWDDDGYGNQVWIPGGFSYDDIAVTEGVTDESGNISYTDSSAVANNTYYYVVAALDAVSNQSGDSNEAFTQASGTSATISGKVLAGGQPVAGTWVYGWLDWDSSIDGFNPTVEPALTDVDGNYSLSLPTLEGQSVKYWLSVYGQDGSTTSLITPPLSPDQAVTNFDINLMLPAPVILDPAYSATTDTPVVSVSGTAAPNALVNLIHSGYDSSWNYIEIPYNNIQADGAGNWQVNVNAFQNSNYLQAIQQSGGQTSNTSWSYFYSNAIVDGATITGKVLSDGVGVSGAMVYIYGSNNSSTVTDAEGNYSFTVPVSSSEYYLYAFKNYGPNDDQWSNELSVLANNSIVYPDNNLIMNMKAPTIISPLSGSKQAQSPVALTGKGQSGATINVSIYQYDQNWNWMGQSTAVGTAEIDGNFNIPLSILTSGNYYVYVSQTVGGNTSASSYTYFSADLNQAIIQGTVSNNGLPVEGAAVYIYQDYTGGNYVGYIPTVETDASGNYSVAVPAGLSYWIYAYDDYGNVSTTKYIANAVAGISPSNVYDLQFKLNAPTVTNPSYGGTVTSSPVVISGTAAPGAIVGLNIDSYDVNWNWTGNYYEATADGTGNWSVEIPATNGYIYITAWQTLDGQTSLSAWSYAYVDQSSTSISGQVTAVGSGLSDATVVAYGIYPSSFYKAVQTDGTGNYSLNVDPNSNYWVYAYKYDEITGNYLYSNWEEITVGGSSVTKNIAMTPPAPKVTAPDYGSTITDNTTTISGKGLANLPTTIKVYGYTASGLYKEDTYTASANGSGDFSKSGIVVYNGYNQVEVWQTDGTANSERAWHYYYGQLAVSSGTLTGIVSQSGAPVSGVTVYAYSNSGWWSSSVTSGADGSYTLKLPAGDFYWLSAYKGNDYTSSVQVPATGTVAEGASYTKNLSLPAAAPTITYPVSGSAYSVPSGKVTATGTSAPNATINLTAYGYNSYGYWVTNNYIALADSLGQWSKEISAYNGENYLYATQTDNLGNTSNQSYVGFNVKGVPMVYEQFSTVSGKVTGSDGTGVANATVYAYTYSNDFTAITDQDGNYQITVPAADGYGTYLTVYAYVLTGGKFGNSSAQTLWVSPGSAQSADFKLSFAGSANGKLSALWNYRQGKIDYRMDFGASPGIANLDSLSGNLEVATGSDEYWAQDPNLTDGASGIWRVFNADGTINWIKSTDNDEARSSVAIADVDSDGKLDIAGGTTSGSQIQLWGNSGIKKWVKGTGGFVHSSPAIADLVPTKTGSEIIGGSYDGKIYVQDKDGNDIWSYDTGSTIVSSPSVGDLDGNGTREVVAASTNGKVYVLSNAGSKLYEFDSGSQIYSSPARADLDKDGKSEIIIGSNNGNVYALSLPSSGTTLTTLWKFNTGDSVYSSPSVADIDKNGNLDVVVGSNSGKVLALTSKGTLKWSYATNGSVYSSAAIADRGNNSVGIYIGSEDGDLYVIEGNGANAGQLIDKFQTGAVIRTSAAVADINGDGKLEIAFSDWRSAGDLFWMIQDSESSVSAYSMQWPQFGFNAGHRRAKLDLSNVSAPAAPTITSPDPSATLYSKNGSQAISGTNASGATVEVFNGSSSLGQATVTGQSWTIAASLAEGTHNITAKATKDALVSEASKTLKVVIDNKAPAINVTGVADGKTYSSGVKAEFSASDATPVVVNATLNGIPYTSGTAINTAGENILVVTATDSAGNPSSKTVTFTITDDNVAPEITFVSPTPENNSAVYSDSQTIKATVKDFGSGVQSTQVTHNNVGLGHTYDPGTGDLDVSLTGLSDGLHTVSVSSTDNVGKIATASTSFYYVAVEPEISISPAAINPGNSVNFTGVNFIPNDVIKLYRITAAGDTLFIGSATSDTVGNLSFSYKTPANISAGTRTFKAKGSYNSGASATVLVNLDIYTDGKNNFKQGENPYIYVNGGEAANSVILTYKTYPDNGVAPVTITPVTKEASSGWFFAKWMTGLLPKGSYTIKAEAKDAGGATIATREVVLGITELDLSLKFVPEDGSTLASAAGGETIAVAAGANVTSVGFSYSTDGTAYAPMGEASAAEDNSYSVNLDTSMLSGEITVKAIPNGDSSNAAYASYTVASQQSLEIYPKNGATINDNPTLYAKVVDGSTQMAKISSFGSKVKFELMSATGEPQFIGDGTMGASGWASVLWDTGELPLVNGKTYKVRATDYDSGKAVYAAYKFESGTVLELVSPADNSAVSGNPFIWVNAGDSVKNVKVEYSTNGVNWNNAPATADDGTPLNEEYFMLKYPNTSHWYFHLNTILIGDSTQFKLKLTPYNADKSAAVGAAIFANYTTESADKLGVQLFPEDETVLKKNAVITAVGESNVQSVEFFYQYYDGVVWTESEPLPSPGASNEVLRGPDDEFFRIELDTQELEEGTYKITAVSYDADKTNGLSVTNTYEVDRTSAKRPYPVTVSQGNKGVKVHWVDPKNQTNDRAGYNVYRNSSKITSIADLKPISYVAFDGSDSSYFYNDYEALTIGGTFFYAVTTVDEAGNESGPRAGNKSVTVEAPTQPSVVDGTMNNGQSQLVLPSMGGDDKELVSIGESPETDSLNLKIEGDEVKDPTIVNLDPINDGSADTKGEKDILDYIEGNEDSNFQLAGSIFDITSKGSQNDKIVNQLTSADSDAEDAGASMEIKFDESDGATPDNYMNKLSGYDEETLEFKAPNNSGVNQYFYPEAWRYGSKLKKVPGQSKKPGAISMRVRRFSAYMVMMVGSPNVQISGVNHGSSYKTSVTPSVSIEQGVNPISSQDVTLNGVPYVSRTPITAEGSYNLVATATDSSGQTTTIYSNFKIDKTKPATTKKLSVAANTYGWNKATVSVTLTGKDNTGGSGMSKILYRIGTSGSYKAYSGPLSFSESATKVLKYYSVDIAGNAEVAKSLTVRVDKVKPLIPSISMSTLSPKAGSSATFYYTVNDKLSPRVNVTLQIRTTGGRVLKSATIKDARKGIRLSKALITPAAAGTYVYRVIAKDYAGNTLIKNVNFKVIK